MNALLITGTDTGVGKTIITASLARNLRRRGTTPGVRKPFASGITDQSTFDEDDALLLQAAAETSETPDQIRPCTLRFPLAPLSAARLEKRKIETEPLLRDVRDCIARSPVTLVEGVGGAAVPIADGLLFSDFAARLGIPALVVARSVLGTVNHTLLTVEHLRSKGVEVTGVVFVRHTSEPPDLAEQTGPSLAAEFAGVKNFGVIPFAADLRSATTLQEAIDALPWDSPPVAAVADWLLSRPESPPGG